MSGPSVFTFPVDFDIEFGKRLVSQAVAGRDHCCPLLRVFNDERRTQRCIWIGGHGDFFLQVLEKLTGSRIFARGKKGVPEIRSIGQTAPVADASHLFDPFLETQSARVRLTSGFDEPEIRRIEHHDRAQRECSDPGSDHCLDNGETGAIAFHAPCGEIGQR